jgi:hypothetical protein
MTSNGIQNLINTALEGAEDYMEAAEKSADWKEKDRLIDHSRSTLMMSAVLEVALQLALMNEREDKKC